MLVVRALVLAAAWIVPSACDGPHPPPRPDCPPNEVEADGVSRQVLERDCKGGDPLACEKLAAKHLLGEGLPRDGQLARDHQQRAFALRLKACHGGDDEACAYVPEEVRTKAPEDSGPLRLELRADGAVVIDGESRTGDLGPLLVRACALRPEAIITAEPAVAYERVVAIMDQLRMARCSGIQLVSAPEPPTAP